MTSSLKSIFDKSDRRAIYLSNDKLTVYHWSGGKLGSSYLFDESEDGQRYFDRYLKETPRLTTYLLVDVVEEEFRQDKIPHVSGSDREAILERKKTRLFRDTPYFHTEIQGRDEGGRRDDQVVIMALTNPDIIEPWVKLLDANKVPLAGIYSLPQITGEILPAMPDPADDMLIVSLQSISGLRQTFFKNGKFKISRLVGLPRYGTEPFAPIINEEVELIQRYLNSMRLLNNEKQLDVYYLADKSLLRELSMEQTDSGTIRHHRVDLEEIGPRTGLNIEVSNPYSDQLFVHHLLKNRPKNTYAQSSERRYQKLKNTRQFMYAASAFMLVGSFIWGGLNFLDGVVHRQQSEVAVKKSDFYRARYEVAQDKMKETEVSPYDLEVVTDIVNTLEQYKTDPFAMYSVISRGLDEYPGIKIDEIQWTSTTDPDLQTVDISSNGGKQGVVGFSNVGADEEKYYFYQVSTLRGHITGFDGDYRRAIKMIESFRDKLKSMENIHDVSITSLPLDISPEKSLQGASGTENLDALFSVRVVMGVKHEQS